MAAKLPTRPRGSGWICNGCRESHGGSPGFDFYTCLTCDQDFCPKCFDKIETVIEPERDGENPNLIKEK